MKTVFTLAIFITFFCGCATHKEPKVNLAFEQISRLSELEGIYKNAGEPSGLLSYIFWPKLYEGIGAKFRHNDIEFIEVTLQDKGTFLVKGIVNGCSRIEKTFILGKDFELKDGRIIVPSKINYLSRGKGDMLIGPSTQDVTLGLDTEKQGKVKTSANYAGLLFAFIPVAVDETIETRFNRVSEKPQNYPPCIRP